MKDESELYQLRADVLRGRALTTDEVLGLIEELQHYVHGDDGYACDECENIQSEMTDALEEEERRAEQQEERADAFHEVLLCIAHGKVAPDKAQELAKKTVESSRRELGNVFASLAAVRQ